MPTLQLNALDTLFFRDGRPFSMGEETWARGIFPPYPSSVYGMLRSIYYADNLQKLALVNTWIDPTSTLNIKGYLPVVRKSDQVSSTPCFPMPCDLYAEKRSDSRAAFAFKCVERPSHALSEYTYDCLLQTQSDETEKIEELEGKAMLELEAFLSYLEDEKDTFPFLRIGDFTIEEPKIGIGRDFITRSSSEGKLYRVAMRRPISSEGELGLLVHFEDLEIRRQGLSRFGAEAKVVEYQAGDFPDIPNPVSQKDQYVKIYLATPAVFPADNEEGETNDIERTGGVPFSWFEDHGLQLLTAAIGRPRHIGGFDLKEKRPKPMRKAVPAGTVYYVKVVDEKKAGDIRTSLHGGSIYQLAPSVKELEQYRIEYQQQGFGLTFLGKFTIQTR